MPKEYRTIQEVAGPLMLVKSVENVKYDELGEIELSDGETRRCKVLEIDGGNALVQLFEPSTGINLSDSKVRFLGRSMSIDGTVVKTYDPDNYWISGITIKTGLIELDRVTKDADGNYVSGSTDNIMTRWKISMRSAV